MAIYNPYSGPVLLGGERRNVLVTTSTRSAAVRFASDWRRDKTGFCDPAVEVWSRPNANARLGEVYLLAVGIDPSHPYYNRAPVVDLWDAERVEVVAAGGRSNG